MQAGGLLGLSDITQWQKCGLIYKKCQSGERERERIIEIVSSKIRCVKTLLINSVIKGEREEDGLQLFLDLFYCVN